jgi:hypothetical protein
VGEGVGWMGWRYFD